MNTKNSLNIDTCRHLFFVSLFFAATIFVNAQTKPTLPAPTSLMGAEATARGSATVASASGYSSLILNPAGAAFAKDYKVGLAYIGAGRSLAASIVDTKSSAIGGGLYYIRRDTRKGEISTKSVGNFRRLEDRVSLSFFGKASDDVAIGVGVKWARRTESQLGISNESNQINADIGAAAKLSYGFRFGASVLNVLDDEKGLHPRNIHLGIEKDLGESFVASLGLGFLESPSDTSTFELPASTNMSWSFGLQYQYQQFIARLGYREELPWNESWLNAGVAWDVEKFSINYSFEGLTKGQGQSLHSVGVEVKF